MRDQATAPGEPLSTGAPRPSWHHSEAVMGTIVTFDAYGELAGDARSRARALARARAGLQRADALFSTYKPDSPINQLRRGEIDEAALPEPMGSVLERCRELRELSAGWFDPWRVPGGVDPTGYVKGWAAEQALAVLATIAPCVIVNAAGDLVVSAALPGGHPVRAGIVDPANPHQILVIAEVTAALATSGTAERGAHLFDPFAGRAQVKAASASVCGADLGTADALATALAVAGRQGLAIIEQIPGYEALVIEEDGHQLVTSGFPRVA